jgi:hypothetical protein
MVWSVVEVLRDGTRLEGRACGSPFFLLYDLKAPVG